MALRRGGQPPDNGLCTGNFAIEARQLRRDESLPAALSVISRRNEGWQTAPGAVAVPPAATVLGSMLSGP